MAENRDPAQDLPRGTRVGEFVVERKLGAGGMGQVYLARQQSLKRDVALKILSPHLAADPVALKRFQAEAEAVARVSHANIVQVYAIGEHDGLRYMALEYVDGRNLKEYLARKTPDLPIALGIMRQVAAALQRASELGLVHRDIKPENILVTRKTEVKVADFGLSRFFAPADGQPLHLTQSGMTLGTPLYMSPEQVQGQPVDHRTDLYSFGVTCYHLLAGRPPFTGTTPFDVAVKHVQVEPEPLSGIRPDLPPDLSAIVHKLMAKRPADRYQTARDVMRDLARVQKGLSTGLPTPTASGSAVTPVLTSGTGSVPAIAAGPSDTAGRGMRVLAGSVALAGLAIGGWLAFAAMHSTADGGSTAAATPGLPDARPPEPVVRTRERELIAALQSRATDPPQLVDAAIELGLLYVRERRLDDASKVFKELEDERLVRLVPVAKGLPAERNAAVAGRIGQAIVLAHRDKATESNDLFVQALYGPPRVRPGAVEQFLLSHPEFGEAIADALSRNAENLHPAKLPERLEWLRTPAGFSRGTRG